MKKHILAENYKRFFKENLLEESGDFDIVLMDDPIIVDRFNELLDDESRTHYTEGDDYEWIIGRGDDYPNTLVILSDTMQKDDKFIKIIRAELEDEEIDY